MMGAELEAAVQERELRHQGIVLQASAGLLESFGKTFCRQEIGIVSLKQWSEPTGS